MSGGEILALVAMVCVTLGLPALLGVYFGRHFIGRATRNGFEMMTDPDSPKRKGK